MSSHSIRKERGFLDTGELLRARETARPGAIGEFFIEAGEMLRGAFEAPLRHAERRTAQGDLDHLSPSLRKDIGLE